MAEKFDASDPDQVNKRKSEVGRRQKADDDVIIALLGNGDGRSWMWRLLERCHVLSQPFDPESDRITAFRLGEMNICQMLLADVLRAAPDSYLLMAKESKENAS